MKWFKHYTKAHEDRAVEKLILEFGVKGYGLYFYCLEIIAGTLDSENITFELEPDAEILARRLSMDTIEVEKIMKRCIEFGLFELAAKSGRITCLKVAKFIDKSQSKNPEMIRMIERFKEIRGLPGTSKKIPENPGGSVPEENRREENIRDNNINMSDSNSEDELFSESESVEEKAPLNLPKAEKDTENPRSLFKTIIDYLNEKANTAYRYGSDKTNRHLNARISEGYSFADFKTVIDKKCEEWMGTEWEKFIRPETLFGTKFESYLNQRIRGSPGCESAGETFEERTKRVIAEIEAEGNTGHLL